VPDPSESAEADSDLIDAVFPIAAGAAALVGGVKVAEEIVSTGSAARALPFVDALAVRGADASSSSAGSATDAARFCQQEHEKCGTSIRTGRLLRHGAPAIRRFVGRVVSSAATSFDRLLLCLIGGRSAGGTCRLSYDNQQAQNPLDTAIGVRTRPLTREPAPSIYPLQLLLAQLDALSELLDCAFPHSFTARVPRRHDSRLRGQVEERQELKAGRNTQGDEGMAKRREVNMGQQHVSRFCA
jgi:hypothetical protein